MIFVGKAPYRVSLLGGGSDLEWFVKEKKYGTCLGFSLEEYSYSVLNILPPDSKKGILEYSTRETYKSINEIVHPIVREVLINLKITRYIELKTFGFASGGSGLGGSTSFFLSLLSSLSKAFNIKMSNEEIIKKACYLEIKKLKKPIGKQDQYLCGNEGFNSFTFFNDNNVKKNNLSSSKISTLSRLSNDFYLIPTYKERNSDLVLSNIQKDSKSVEKLLEIREIVNRFLLFDDERDYKIEEFFNKCVKDSWTIKKSLSQVMSNNLKQQYELINKLIPNNWIRLIGAGNGGYFLISSRLKLNEINKISENFGVRGIFKANISHEGVSSYMI